jgi:hypothetical protein
MPYTFYIESSPWVPCSVSDFGAGPRKMLTDSERKMRSKKKDMAKASRKRNRA